VGGCRWHGGPPGRRFASQTIIAALDAIPPPQTARQLMVEVWQALDRANNDLLAHAERYGAERPGGRAIVASTVVCLLVFEGHFAGVWAGDSRLYLLRDGNILQVSHDHSVVQEMVDAGLIDGEAARRHPSGNQVTRAIGVEGGVEPEVVQDELHPGDVFLLCSDGITRIVEDTEIGGVLVDGEPAEAVRTLIDLALSRGAPDNATAVVVRCGTVSEKGGGGYRWLFR